MKNFRDLRNELDNLRKLFDDADFDPLWNEVNELVKWRAHFEHEMTELRKEFDNLLNDTQPGN